MIEKIKKYWYVFPFVFVISFGMNVFLLVDSTTLEDIIYNLQKENEGLDKKLKESTLRETAFLNEIKTKTAVIADLDSRLIASRQSVDRLKNEVASLKQPEDPQTFKDLEECRGKYTSLSQDMKLTLEFSKETENSLDLCLAKSKEQEEVIILAEQSYQECRKQLEIKDEKITNLQSSLKDLDRYYKRRLVKRGIVKYIVGAAVGAGAGYFLFKKR